MQQLAAASEEGIESKDIADLLGYPSVENESKMQNTISLFWCEKRRIYKENWIFPHIC